MIVFFFVQLFAWIVTGVLSLLALAPIPAIAWTSLSTIVNFMGSMGSFLPLDAVWTVFTWELTFEGVVLLFRGGVFAWNLIRGSGA